MTTIKIVTDFLKYTLSVKTFEFLKKSSKIHIAMTIAVTIIFQSELFDDAEQRIIQNYQFKT